MWQSWLSLLVALVVLADGTAAPVSTRMRNIVFHLGYGAELHVYDLTGRLISRHSDAPPVFDDVNSYVLEITSARVSMTAESLTRLMNDYVFADPNAPLKNLEIRIQGDQLIQTGTLKKGVGIPFAMHGTIAATADGRIRIHPTGIRAAGILPKAVLDFFGLELERVVKLNRTPAVSIAGDDLLLDPERLLPPPQIRGRLTRTWIEDGRVYEQFGEPSVRTGVAPPINVANYMYYRGGRLRFGKLTMEDTDLLLVDADPKDPFDFSPERYNEQLVAGYSKNTPSHGLIVYMPDLNDLSAGRRAR